MVLAVNPGIAKRPHYAMALTMISFGAVNWTYTWFDSKGPSSLDTVAELTTQRLLGDLDSI